MGALKEKLLFVNNVPFLYPELNVARQVQIEVWLDLATLIKELDLTTSSLRSNQDEVRRPKGYVV